MARTERINNNPPVPKFPQLRWWMNGMDRWVVSKIAWFFLILIRLIEAPESLFCSDGQGLSTLCPENPLPGWQAALVFAFAFGQVEISKYVQLVKGCQDGEDEVPDQQQDSKLAVQLPSVEVRGRDQEDHGRKQAQSRVQEAWGIGRIKEATLNETRHRQLEQWETSTRVPSSPLLWTLTYFPGLTMAVSRNQGNPRQTRMSKTLLPMAFDTAIFPWPAEQESQHKLQFHMSLQEISNLPNIPSNPVQGNLKIIVAPFSTRMSLTLFFAQRGPREKHNGDSLVQ